MRVWINVAGLTCKALILATKNIFKHFKNFYVKVLALCFYLC